MSVVKTATDDMLIQLRDGPTVTVKSIRAALALEAKGVTMRVDGEDLWLSPDVVPPAWLPALKALKPDLIKIAAYIQGSPGDVAA